MTHHLNHDRTAAVAADTYWMPIDASTPRGVNVFAIARHTQNIATSAKLKANEDFYTHWHPVPAFRPDCWAPYDAKDDLK